MDVSNMVSQLHALTCGGGDSGEGGRTNNIIVFFLDSGSSACSVSRYGSVCRVLGG